MTAAAGVERLALVSAYKRNERLLYGYWRLKKRRRKKRDNEGREMAGIPVERTQ